MNRSIIRYLLCRVLQFEGFFLLLPVLISIIYREKEGFIFAGFAALFALLGSLGAHFKPKSDVFYAREGFVTVSLAWILLSLTGSLPFVVTGEIPNYIDAIFETASGFTTTGATILTDVETLCFTSQFWRCFTIWIGGMGVLVFIMSVLPLSGSHNMHLMRAESTGADVGKLVPKVKDTAKILYSIYFSLTIALIVLYFISGMNLYDAVITGFSTVGTGGFANKNASLGAYGHATQVISTIFMILCGINFNAYFLVIRGKVKDIFKMEEVRIYLAILFICSIVISFGILDYYSNWGEAFHNAIFQVASIMTTTGFSTTDYNNWPMFTKGILVFLTFVGACAGSTGGGIKISRLLIWLKSLKKELGHLSHPRSVLKVHMSKEVVAEDTVNTVGAFLVAYCVTLIGSFLLICLNGFDFESSFTAVVTAISNVGPGLSMVGPAGNFSQFSGFSKLVLSFDMLAGRLELLPMFVLFSFSTWKKN